MRVLRPTILICGLCVLGIVLTIGVGQAEATGPRGPKSAPKKIPAAKAAAKPTPSAKLGPKKKPIAKATRQFPKTHAPTKPLNRPPLATRPFPKNRVIARGTGSYLLPPIYLGQPYVQPTLVVPRVIRSTTERVRIATSAETSEDASEASSSTARPDLAVTNIYADYSDSDDSNNRRLHVRVKIKNLGGAAFRSDEGAQVLALYRDGEIVAEQGFQALEAGQVISLATEAQPTRAVYEARILFAEGLLQDGNPLNDDMNPTNNLLSRELDFSQVDNDKTHIAPL